MKQYGLLNEKGENFCCGCPTVMIDDKGTEHLFSYYTEIMTRTKADKCRMIYAKQYPDNDYTTDVLFLDNEYFLD